MGKMDIKNVNPYLMLIADTGYPCGHPLQAMKNLKRTKCYNTVPLDFTWVNNLY